MTDIYSTASDARFPTATGTKRPITNADGSGASNRQNGAKLSPRELQILQLLSNGQINKQISDIVRCSERTVETTRVLIFAKLNAKNAPHAVRIGFELGILDSALETAYEALLEKVGALREVLIDLHTQNRCGCNHPACNRCANDRLVEAALASKDPSHATP